MALLHFVQKKMFNCLSFWNHNELMSFRNFYRDAIIHSMCTSETTISPEKLRQSCIMLISLLDGVLEDNFSEVSHWSFEVFKPQNMFYFCSKMAGWAKCKSYRHFRAKLEYVLWLGGLRALLGDSHLWNLEYHAIPTSG